MFLCSDCGSFLPRNLKLQSLIWRSRKTSASSNIPRSFILFIHRMFNRVPNIQYVNMPPRIALQTLQFVQRSSPSFLPPSFLLPFLNSQTTRYASILSSLSDTPGSYSKRIRRGRGPSSGKGKTSGRGHKGQGQHGKVPAHFNGGQTPDHIVAGPQGFNNM